MTPRPFARSHAALALNPQAFGMTFACEPAAENVVKDGIAIVYVRGPLEHHADAMGFDSYDAIVGRVADALADDDARCVVLSLDSPGGDAAGCIEAHRKIRALAGQHGKPVFAYSDEAAYSAAYALASAADEIWLPETGGVGSVGVIASLIDRTRANEAQGLLVELLTTGARKADTHPDRELTDEIRDEMQAKIDQIGDAFFGIVSEARGMSADAVRALEAGCYSGALAVEAGLADGVAGWSDFLATISNALDIPPTHAESVRTTGQSPKGSDMAAKLLQITQARDEAKRAMLAATPETRAALTSAFEAANLALAKAKCEDEPEKKDDKDAKAEGDEPKDDAKTAEDGEDDDKEAEVDEAEEKAKDKAEKAKKAKRAAEDAEVKYKRALEDAEEGEDDKDAEEGEDEKSQSDVESEAGKKAAATLDAKTGLYTYARLYRLACQVTGKTDPAEVFGALSAIQVREKAHAKLTEKHAKLAAEVRGLKVDALIAQGIAERKVTPADAKKLATHDPKYIAGWLHGAVARVRTVEEERVPATDAEGAPATLASLPEDARKFVLTSAMADGKNPNDVARELGAIIARKGTAAPRY